MKEEYIAIVKPIPVDSIRQKEVKKVRVESPLGAIESDSGNHLVDIGTVLLIMALFFMMKKFFQST